MTTKPICLLDRSEGVAGVSLWRTGITYEVKLWTMDGDSFTFFAGHDLTEADSIFWQLWGDLWEIIPESEVDISADLPL